MKRHSWFTGFPILLATAQLPLGCERSPDSEGSAGSERAAEPAPSASAAPATSLAEAAPAASAAPEPAASAELDTAPDEPPPPHPGPWLWVTRASAGVYPTPAPSRDDKIGYVMRGGKVPILADKVEGRDCPKGWRKVVSGGYICENVGTTNEKDPIAKFPPRQPNLDDILPYQYARNAYNGTPLYRSLPSRAQMDEYEPYLKAARLAKEAKKSAENAEKTAAPIASAPEAKPEDVPPPEAPTDEKKPWWESGDNLHEVKLEDLGAEADGVLAKRMVRGFYVAIDRIFNWNGRTWYKTTRGLVAPSDRFWQAAAPEFHGQELDGEKWKLPVAWVYGQRKTTSTYEIDPEAGKIAPKGTVKKFEPIQLTGETLDFRGKLYQKLADGTYVRDDQVRVTTPEKRPDGIGEHERWVDVDVSEQTVVVFEGDRALYATLTSTGKESKIKNKDHSTPRGMWRVREKHLVTTMDGNGTAAGDLPYSIEDVPYVAYYHRAYAIHGAFWHQNFGSQMSHGCVNLAPLDAKWVFFNTAPYLPEGLSGVWSRDERPGSMVVVHD